MKKIIQLVFLIMALVLGPTQVMAAKDISYRITDQDIVAEVQPNGDVRITQKWYYDAEYINGALLKVDYDKYTLSQYKIGVEDVSTHQITYFKEAASGQKATFETSSKQGVMTFKAYYPLEKQKAIFVAEYTLEHLVTNYHDTAELNRKLVGYGVDFTTNVTAKILLPGKVSEEGSLKAWAHGAPQGQIVLSEEDGKSIIQITVPNNPANTMVEAHVIFPTSLTPTNTNNVPQDMKAQIEKQEADQVAKDKAAYQQEQLWKQGSVWLAAVLLPIGPLLVAWLYFKWKKQLNPQPIKLPEHNYSLPSKVAPAVISAAVFRKSGRPAADDFAATVADLARKKYISLTEERREKRGWFDNQSTTVRIQPLIDEEQAKELPNFEKQVFRFLCMKAPKDGQTLEQLEHKMEKSRTFAKQQQRQYEGFVDSVEVQAEQLVETARTKNHLLGFLAIFSSVVQWIVTIFVIFISGLDVNNGIIRYLILGLIAMTVVNGVMLVLILLRPLRTAEEDRLYQEWHGFAKMLEDIGQMDMRDIASLALWEEYLVYAIAFGLADKVLKALAIQFTQEELMTGMMYYPMYYNTHIYTGGLTNGISSSVISANTYSGDNSSGSGGGFSGGSSFGSGGGGGAGAF